MRVPRIESAELSRYDRYTPLLDTDLLYARDWIAAHD
jgi:hypothetical protein